MKKLLLVSILFKAMMIPMACTSGSSSSANAGQIVSSGTWKVTLFVDNGTDQTTNFTGYVFTFNSNGSVTAINGSVTKNGAWSVNNSSNKFNIDLGPKDNTNQPIGDLTDDWQIISASNTEIKLKNGNSTNNEFLTFTKN